MAQLTIRMPALSATMEDALLIEWLVAPGDEIRSGQAIAEVSTDKVDMQLESPYDGVVDELLVEPNTQVDLGDPVALVASDEEDLLGGLDLDGSGDAAGDASAGSGDGEAGGAADGAQPSDAAVPDEPGAVPDPAVQPEADHPRRIIPAPPPVRWQAKRMGIDLAAVTPTGSRGQVTRADLARHVEQQEVAPASPAPAASTPAPAASTSAPADTPAAAATPTPAATPAPAPGATPAEMDARTLSIRRATARSTTASAAVPQFTLYRRVDVTNLMARRDGRSIMTELARALAASLWRHPELNAQWDDEQRMPVRLPSVRIGVAVATDNGLVVVGVDDPDAVEPGAADQAMRDAISRGRAGKLRPDDMQGVSTTISNLGGMGVDHFNALLLPPQATILSVGRSVDTPVVSDGRVVVRPMMQVGLTVDHRVADGADGAAFLETFVTRLGG